MTLKIVKETIQNLTESQLKTVKGASDAFGCYNYKGSDTGCNNSDGGTCQLC